jgi:hypothetical protein
MKGTGLNLTVHEHIYRGKIVRVIIPVDLAEEIVKPDPIDEFLDLMLEYAAGGLFQPRRVFASYCQVASERSWPTITERVLTKELCARGCKKRFLDLRSGEANRQERIRYYGGKQRPVVIEFPAVPRSA